jgi:hypothetical protein
MFSHLCFTSVSVRMFPLSSGSGNPDRHSNPEQNVTDSQHCRTRFFISVGLPDQHTDPLVSGTDPRIRSNNPDPAKNYMQIFSFFPGITLHIPDQHLF